MAVSATHVIILCVSQTTFIIQIILQLMSTDSVKETIPEKEFPQHSTRSCVITQIT